MTGSAVATSSRRASRRTAGDTELSAVAMRLSLPDPEAQIFDSMRSAWLELDSFVIAHRFEKEAQAGLRGEHPSRISLDILRQTFGKMSDKCKDIFLHQEVDSRRVFGVKQLAFSLHTLFESGLTELSKVGATAGRGSGQMTDAIEIASGVKNKLGELMLGLEAAMLPK